MAIDSRGILDALTSFASSSGLFDAVNAHEPKSAPGSGIAASVWITGVEPILSSGLGSVSARLEMQMRLQTSMLQEPQDGIDPALLDAADAMFAAIIADFELNGRVRHVDVLGAHGERLRMATGYVSIGSTLYRVMDLFIPVIINDVWTESP